MVDALVLWHQGAPERARRGVEETLRDLRAGGDLEVLAGSGLLYGLYLECDRGAPAEALVVAEEMVRVSGPRGFLFWHAIGVAGYGWALGMTDDPEQGLAILERGVQQLVALGSGMSTSHVLTLQARLLAAMGRHAEALAVVERSLALAARRSEGRWMPEMHRLRGELLFRTGATPETALAALSRARETAAAQGDRMLELRALCSLVRVGAAGARADLSALYAGFTEGWDEPDLRDARALLEDEPARRGETGTSAA
jgi:hypothetical protein